MKYHLITYGCQMNTADSEEMAQPLISRGLRATADPEQADVIIMNTCTVRDQAEHRADSNLGRLRKWKEKDPHRLLIVAGCAASRWGESIRTKYPFIDLVSPATQIAQFPDVIEQVLRERWNFDDENRTAWSVVREPKEDSSVAPFGPRITDHAASSSPFLFGTTETAYVTIMRGCNYQCTYCIVPQVRGREIYRPLEDIVRDIQTKVAQGQREVMLLGQTVNSYSSSSAQTSPGSKPFDFADLLRAVNAVPGVERIRFMSPHPRHMRERVIQAMAKSEKVCRHIHLPLQSGSACLLVPIHCRALRD